jgi:hypothetical protein
VFAYNKRLLPPAEVPKTHADLERLLRTHPAYAGKVATYDPERSAAGFLYITQDLQITHDTWALIRAMGGMKLQLYSSTEAMLDRVASGEYLLAYNIVGPYAFEQQARDPSIGVVVPAGQLHALSPRTGRRGRLVVAVSRRPRAHDAFPHEERHGKRRRAGKVRSWRQLPRSCSHGRSSDDPLTSCGAACCPAAIGTPTCDAGRTRHADLVKLFATKGGNTVPTITVKGDGMSPVHYDTRKSCPAHGGNHPRHCR